MIDLRLGDWRTTLADVECDALITDPPFSERTHSGHRVGVEGAEAPMRVDRRTGAKYSAGKAKRRAINYKFWTAEDAHDLCAWAGEHCRGWMVVLTDHVLSPAFEEGMRAAGRYVFAPLPLVETGRSVRLTGDGPSSWVVWMVVSRPRSRKFASWGTLPGAYVVGGGPRNRHIGGKPIAAMRAIVRDYSRPGDLVCDPCAGGATTLRAALMEGRRAIGSELDPETHRKACGIPLESDSTGQRDLFAKVGS